jgi:pimeloyl-ACP methyl ester carboxylesterase
MPIEYMLRHRFESIKYAPSLTVPTYVLRAAEDDVVPHSHTDELVAKLANLVADETVPGSDHMNIPYLEATQALIASFLTRQFSQSVETPALPAVEAKLEPVVEENNC